MSCDERKREDCPALEYQSYPYYADAFGECAEAATRLNVAAVLLGVGFLLELADQYNEDDLHFNGEQFRELQRVLRR